MKTSLRPPLICLLLSFCSLSCSQDDNTPTPAPPVTADGFTWKEDGGAAITADSAFWTSGGWGAGVRAYKNGMANFFEINFSDAGTGTKSLAGGFTFLKGSDTYNAATGSVDITSAADDLLTGTFSATLTGGSISAVSGSFTHLPKR